MEQQRQRPVLRLRQPGFELDGERYPLRLRRLPPVVDSRTRTRQARLEFIGAQAPAGSAGRLRWEAQAAYLPPELLVRRDGGYVLARAAAGDGIRAGIAAAALGGCILVLVAGWWVAPVATGVAPLPGLMQARAAEVVVVVPATVVATSASTGASASGAIQNSRCSGIMPYATAPVSEHPGRSHSLATCRNLPGARAA